MSDEYKLTYTSRGFGLIEFKDRYDIECSLQASSLATESAIWFGVSDPKPQVMASQAAALGITTANVNGWVPYPLPEGVLLHTRMHLTQAQVSELLPILAHFAETGELTDSPPAAAQPAPAITYPTQECTAEVVCGNCQGEGRLPVEGGYRGDGLLQPPDPPSFERCEDCEGTGKEAASATDAGQKAIEALELAMNNLGASRPTPEWEHDRALWDTYQAAIDGLRATPAQATPEGGQDLPAPVLTVEIFRRGRVERHQPNQNYYTEEQMRAALAAGRPVSRHPLENASDDDLWHIATTVVSMVGGGGLFNFSQREVTMEIRAAFMSPDEAREYLAQKETGK
jgi:hypothetical protein